MKTTIQLSDALRKKLKLLAASRDLPYEDLLNDLIDVFKANIPFESEEQFARWFENNLNKFGFSKILEKRKNTSPDYLIETMNGKKVNVELEMTSKDFDRHGHDPKDVDIIVTVYSTQRKFRGVPVLSLIDSEDVKNRVLREKKTTIKIPRELYNSLLTVIKNTGFSSVTEFIVYAMRNIASGGRLKEEDRLTDEEVRKVRERLRKLGYID